jgi:Fic family protein
MTVQYALPDNWIRYDPTGIVNELVGAKAAVLSLTSIPYQRSWADRLQEMELKREVAGTSRIEGADFTDRELDEAISDKAPEDQLTRSQRQARSAINTYRWIEKLPLGRPVDTDLIREIHSRIVRGCDDDHCPPGVLRGSGQNVTFGRPRHRGVEGGVECERALARLVGAFNQEFRNHDSLVQALALHYHFGAMHPFYDGNGRTARAIEALLLRRAQLRDTLFIAMSNYYYDEKDKYLSTLSKVRQHNHDLTPFLRFGLIGISHQCGRLLAEIRVHVQKSLFRDVMGKLYGRLRSTRKRALAHRQIEILNKLLDKDESIEYLTFYQEVEKVYFGLKAPIKAYVRDLNHLGSLRAISIKRVDEHGQRLYPIAVCPEWATEITETQFYKEMEEFPAAKTRLYVSIE